MAEPVVAPKSAGAEQTPARALVAKFAKQIERACKDREELDKRIIRYRKRVAGDQHSDGAGGLVRTNLTFAHIQTAVPNTYAKNPDVSVTPSDAVPREQLKAYKKLAKVCEKLLKRRFIRDGKIKRRARAMLRSAFTTGDGWLKVVFIDTPPTQNPVSAAAPDDETDNAKRVQALQADLANCTDEEKRKTIEAEIEQQTKALTEGRELPPLRAVAIDKVRSEDIVILDPTINEFDDYDQASAIAQCIWFTKEDYEAEFGAINWEDTNADLPTLWSSTVDDNGQRVYRSRGGSGSSDGRAEKPSEGEHCYIRVWEIWHRTAKTIYTWADGRKDWCREPAPPKYFGERFYGFFRLGFNAIDGMVNAISDVALLEELQDEYNTTRTNFAEHRKESLPVRLMRKAGNLSDEDIRAIQARKLGDIVLVGGKPGKPLQEDLFEFPSIKIDPMVYDTTPIRTDMEMVVGRQDAEVGAVQKAKTATEASIMAQGSNTRSGFKNDTMEDLLTEMCEYVLQIFFQAYTPQEVAKVAGPDALEVWPQLNIKEAFDFLSVDIIAGSMQKPNAQMELEKWTQLLPILKDAILTIAQLRAQGMLQEADAITKLAQETVHRFEDRLDIEGLLGVSEDGEQSMVLQLQQQNQQLQQQVMQLQQQMEAAGKQVQDAMSQAESKQAEAQKLAADAESKVAAVSKENEGLKQKAQVRETELQAQLRKQTGDLENQRREFETAKMKDGYERQIADLTAQLQQASEAMKAAPQQQQQGGEQLSQLAQVLVETMQGLQSAIAEMKGGDRGDMAVEYDDAGRVVGLKRRVANG